MDELFCPSIPQTPGSAKKLIRRVADVEAGPQRDSHRARDPSLHLRPSLCAPRPLSEGHSKRSPSEHWLPILRPAEKSLTPSQGKGSSAEPCTILRPRKSSQWSPGAAHGVCDPLMIQFMHSYVALGAFRATVLLLQEPHPETSLEHSHGVF